MNTSEEKNDPTDGDNPEEPILNKLIRPLVNPEDVAAEDHHPKERRQEEQTLPPGMPPLI
jgi:hypothetical protein